MKTTMRWRLLIAAVIMCATGGSVLADHIYVHNEADVNIYVAIYYRPIVGGTAKRQDKFKSKMIKSGAQEKIDLSGKKIGSHRELVFAFNKDFMRKEIGDKVPFEYFGTKKIGTLRGEHFYIDINEGKLKAFNAVEWKVIEPVIEKFASIKENLTAKLKKEFKKYLPPVKNNAYKKQSAQVTIRPGISSTESSSVNARMSQVKPALEKFLDRKLNNKQVPKIAFVCSGGGHRAMLGTLGFWAAAENLGLFDSATYVVGLSGSTWALSSWLASGKSIAKFRDWLYLQLSRGILKKTRAEARLLGDAVLTKMCFDQPVGWVDMYGLSISNVLLNDKGDMRQMVTLADLDSGIKNGNKPWPICTAVLGHADANHIQKKDYTVWTEWDPFEISWDKFHVPSWAFGRKFMNGKSQDFAPPQPLGFMQGAWGSAFAANIGNIYDAGIKDMVASDFVRKALEKAGKDKAEKRIIPPAPTNNFTLGMKNSPLSNMPVMSFVDAGAMPGFNLPYPPVSGERPGRKADIVIFLDVGQDVVEGDARLKDFHAVERYAREHKLPYPEIDYKGAVNKAVNVFSKSKDKNAPLVIYMPLTYDKDVMARADQDPMLAPHVKTLAGFNVSKCAQGDFCKTSNFSYDLKQARKLSTSAELNMTASIQTIKDAINAYIDTH